MVKITGESRNPKLQDLGKCDGSIEWLFNFIISIIKKLSLNNNLLILAMIKLRI